MNFSVPYNSGIEFIFLTPGLSDALTCFLHLQCLADLSALGFWQGSGEDPAVPAGARGG